MDINPNDINREGIDEGPMIMVAKKNRLVLVITSLIATLCMVFITTGSLAGDGAVMAWQEFDGSSVPVNGIGNQYPRYYDASEGGVFTGSMDGSFKRAGARSLKMSVTSGGIYAQFNPFGPPGTSKYFASDYTSNPSGWQFNTYNRIRFWIYASTNSGISENTAGKPNFHFGTYVKRRTNPDLGSDETGGHHYYHYFLITKGAWTKCIFNSHPTHERDSTGDTEQGNRPYPTTPPYGSGDPANTYNYMDTLSRVYLDGVGDGGGSYPTDYWLDEMEFYQETSPENDDQVYTICASARPSDSRIYLTWNHRKDTTETHEVRYAFSDIHNMGWANANVAPGGTVSRDGSGGYNLMHYSTTSINVSGQSTIYLAIKPSNSNVFSQISLPLGEPPAGGQNPNPLVPNPPANLSID